MWTTISRSSAGLLCFGVIGVWTLARGWRTPAWVEVARAGQLIAPEAIEHARKKLADAPRDLRKKAEPLLDKMAATSADAEGLLAARARLAEALPGLAAPDHQASGEDVGVATVKQCALVLYHGLLARAGAAARKAANAEEAAAQLLEAARGIEGLGEGLVDDLLAELREALGPSLYDRARAILDARARP